MEITKGLLKKCLPNAREIDIEKYVDNLNDLMKKFNIDTPLRISHFLSQIAVESGSLRYNVELGSKEYFNKYDGKYGNVEKGDGYKYRGRGLIQLTFKSNYKSFGEFADLDCVEHPELLEDPYYSVLSAIYYWEIKGLNYYADRNNIEIITRLINGGFNHLNERKKHFERIYDILK